METQVYYYIFFTLGFLQQTWFLGYKKYTNKKQTVILTLILLIEFISTIFQIGDSDLFLLAYFILQPFFVLRHLNSWILMTLFLFLNNSFLILSWLFSYDFLKLLFENGYISLQHFQQYTNLTILLQQLLLFLFIQGFNYFDKRFSIFDSISRIQKKYKIQSIIGIILLIILGIARRIIVNGHFTESFFYITVVLLILNVTVHLTAYIYSQYYQQTLEKNILSRQFNQEMEKITLSDEFRHDYRNILLSLNSYIQNGETKEALDFIHSIVNYSQPLLEDSPYEQLSNIEIPAIQGLLIKFLDLAKTKGIKLNLSIPTSVYESDISIQLADFIQCLSVSLSYALDGHEDILLSIKKDQKQIYIALNNNATDSSNTDNLFKDLNDEQKNEKKTELHRAKKILSKYKKTSFKFYTTPQHFLLQFDFPVNDSGFSSRKIDLNSIQN
ncbi:hypothetical protein [Enterococcus rotai]|uniref:hypothetical protein n=1 Tax=Enterococcus rotai TaxID=118060 RepID=UPI0032B373CD